MATQEQINPLEELQALARAEKEFQALAQAAVDGDGDEGDLRALAGEAGAAMLAAASRYTAEHSDDVVMIADAICDQMEIGSPERADLLAAARLHDIGKTSIPMSIIEKAGPLTGEEWEQMKQHTIAGQRILSAIPELAVVGTIVRHSHERWDGRGYPDGLAGDEIPLASRVIFCADAFDAIRCTRPYRDGATATESLAEIKRNSGTQFDPDVVTALIDVTRRLRLVPVGRWTGNASRLASLLMIVALGATGSAAAQMGLLDSPNHSAAGPGPAPAAVPALTQCVSFDCSSLLAVSLSDQFRAGESRAAADAAGAAGATSAGLDSGASAPGRGDDAAAGGATETPGSDPGASEISQPSSGGSPGAATPVSDAAPAGSDQSGGGQSQGGGSSGSGSSGNSGNGNSGNSGTSGTSGSSKPGNSGNGNGNANGNSGNGHGSSGSSKPGNSGHGSSGSGNPGNSGNSGNGNGNSGSQPQGGPPGQTGQHPQGGPPGQTGNTPPSQPQGGSSGGSNGNGPGGSGPPGQAKKS